MNVYSSIPLIKKGKFYFTGKKTVNLPENQVDPLRTPNHTGYSVAASLENKKLNKFTVYAVNRTGPRTIFQTHATKRLNGHEIRAELYKGWEKVYKPYR